MESFSTNEMGDFNARDGMSISVRTITKVQQTPISNFPNELLAGFFGNGHMVFRPEASFNMWPKNVGQDLVLMIRNTTTLTLHKKSTLC